MIPSDEAQAQAGAIWAKRLHSDGVAVIRGETPYDRVMATAFRDEAGAIGLRIAKTGSGPERRTVSDLAYAAVEPSERAALRLAKIMLRVMATDALFGVTIPGPPGPAERLITSATQDPSQLPSSGQRFVRDFRRRYGRAPGRYAAYGYEAMAVVLDSIRRAGDAGDDRDSVVSAFFDTSDRDSILGRYSIDDVGNTTLNRLAGYRVREGRPVFTTDLRAAP